MNSLNRTITPEFKSIDEIHLIEPEMYSLTNGIPLHFINVSDQEVMRVEVIFPAGERVQKNPLVAKSCNSLIKNGTSRKNAKQIAEEVDQFGAFLETEVTQDTASVLLYSLNKHLEQVLPILKEVLVDAQFPENEIGTYVQNSRQKYSINQGKVGFLARTTFNKVVFGDQHPYGIKEELSDFDNLSREDIINFYKEHYQLSNCKVFLAGNVSKDIIDLFQSLFGSIVLNANTTKEVKPSNHVVQSMNLDNNSAKILKEDSVQSAIRIGRLMCNKTHADYHGLQVLNAILGGYFGSRLMSNLREDKGYTYGIGSAVASLQDTGCFFIATEIRSDVVGETLVEIYKEIGKLRAELVSQEELQLVKNYMLGSFLRGIDGSFALMDKFKGIHLYDLDYSYYKNYCETIKSITPELIRNLAQAYLKEEDLIEVIAGAK